MTSALQDAFHEMFPQVESPEAHFVTLYEVKSLYGGPEEGGWWYDWYTPIATKQVPTEDMALELQAKIRKRAEEMRKESAREWARSMRESCEWAEARGLDPADLPEPDGPDNFVVMVENTPGEYKTTERPHYC